MRGQGQEYRLGDRAKRLLLKALQAPGGARERVWLRSTNDDMAIAPRTATSKALARLCERGLAERRRCSVRRFSGVSNSQYRLTDLGFAIAREFELRSLTRWRGLRDFVADYHACH